MSAPHPTFAPNRAPDAESPDICPHVNLNDPRCSSRFSLGRMDQAFSVCFGSYRGCPMYHRINGENHPRNHGNETPCIAGGSIVTLTRAGSAVAFRRAAS